MNDKERKVWAESLKPGDKVIIEEGHSVDWKYNKLKLCEIKTVSKRGGIFVDDMWFTWEAIAKYRCSYLRLYPADEKNLNKLEYRKLLRDINQYHFDKIPLEDLGKIRDIINKIDPYFGSAINTNK